MFIRTFTFEFLLIFVFINVYASLGNHEKPYESLYTAGVDAYLANNWKKCISYMEDAIKEEHWWEEQIVSCRNECDSYGQKPNQLFPLQSLGESDIVFEKAILNTFCVVKCRKEIFGKNMNEGYTPEIKKFFYERKPYDYLQLCYFKMGKFSKAADAAATVLGAMPYHEVMRNNLDYYIEYAQLDNSSILDLEFPVHATKYLAGISAYEVGDYKEAIENMESSLDIFWKALNRCRTLCDDSLNNGWYPDFISLVANAYTYTLRCRTKCVYKLSKFLEDEEQDFLLNVFHYLQVAYHEVDDHDKACEAIETALTLAPEESIYYRNKQFMLTHSPDHQHFEARKDVLTFYERENSEQNLIKLIEENFVFVNSSAKQNKTKSVTKEEILPNDIKLSASGKDLNGSDRFVADGVLSPSDCSDLILLAKQGSIEGDGYGDRQNPHTNSESFLGINISRISLLVHAGLIDISVLERLLNSSLLSKNYLKSHFNLTEPLFFSFTHLVCREAKDLKNRTLSDLSHEIHADNCVLQPNGECLKIPPAYTFRDFSAVLYLNDDFEGGEFIFTKDQSGQSYESIVKPKCGRLVGFTAGVKDSHGVRGVTRGSRCAIAMWFTSNRHYREVERVMAIEMVQKIKDGIIPIRDEL